MTPLRSRRRIAAVLATAAALVAAGCAAEDKDDTSNAASGAPSIAAVAPGVTADTVKIGVVYPDLTAVKHILKSDHGDYEATYRALIKKINDAGGISGRKIEPVFGAINVASPAAAQETCVKLTQDEKVFAVIGTLNANEPLCYVQTNKTAVIGGPLTAKNYGQAQAPWFSDQRGGDEVGPGIDLFKEALAGKKVAVVGVVNEQSLVQDIVVPALRKLGVTPVETGILDANFRDAAAVAQQTGVFIQKFEASGADTVVVVGGMAASLPKELEKTDYRPRLLFTNTNTIGAYINDTAQHDYTTMTNAIAIAPNLDWNEPQLQECIATVEAAIPDLKGKLTDPNLLPAGTTPTPQVSLDGACRNVALFKAIAAKAGKDLNHQTFQQAGFSLGAFPLPRFVDKANYSKDAPHGAIPPVLWKYEPTTRKFVLANG
ncbi:ABC transporter substrate-binding protein [Yinghuangia sp. YIM S10712]|uniref:ABC transporter substrate-binding protein n=1 Tax=Yinghuangia sp. YIM S10712 TaxID=3436930 RepID=UPI003F52B4FF